MRRSLSVRSLPAVVVCVLSVAWSSGACWAESIVLESAQLGTTGHTGGTSITANQHVGWRFHIDEPLVVDQVGGHLLAYSSILGDIYAALIRLQSIDSFPQGSPYTAEEVVAATTFRPGFPSDEYFTPLSALLIPGDYALVFGSNEFGATGEAAMHNGLDQPDIPPTDISSYIFWGIPGPNKPPTWRTNLAYGLRFIIEGHSPIDGDLNGDGFVGLDDVDIVLINWNLNVTAGDLLSGDPSGDGYVGLDDLDIVLNDWNAGTPADAIVFIPEPTTLILFAFMGLIGLAGRSS